MISKATISDFQSAYSMRSRWLYLAVFETLMQYRRSILGPFWITLNMLLMISALAAVYGFLFNMELRDYMPYVACGLVPWTLISSLIVDGTSTFVVNGGTIKNNNTPYAFFAYKGVTRQMINFAHHLAVLIPVYAIFPHFLTLKVLLVIPFAGIYAINGVCFAILLGMLCSRFRDVPNVISNLVYILFLVTPVFWPAGSVNRPFIVHANPFYHFIEIIREPLMGQWPSLLNLGVVISVTLVNILATVVIFDRYRARIVHTV